jgi:predicted acetyltransferase
MTEIELRAGTPGDWPAISALLARAFHYTPDPDAAAADGAVFEPERSLVAEDAGRVVGHAAAFTRDLTVPGAVLPAAHVTMVGVAATHRRRRLLTRMMLRQLREVRAAGREPIAVLWASEGRIYSRFGYGLAAHKLELEIDTREVRLPAGAPAALRPVDPASAWPEFAAIRDRLRPDRPGWSSRDEHWWRFVLSDPPGRRDGATEWQAAVHDGDPGGYAVWRTRSGWSGAGPHSVVEVREVVAGGPDAYVDLWRLLLDLDLTRTVRYPAAAVDEPLLHLVDEPRRLGSAFSETLWVRLVDLPGALTARRYAAPADVVLDVQDPLLPENTGRWRLTTGPGGTTCVPSTGPADLACTINELGAAYLGGVSLGALATAGRVRELTPGALAAAGTAFGWHRLPAAAEVF